MAMSMAVENQICPRHIVPIQLKILIPVGTAISRLMIEKNGSSTTPVVNMWCAHTPSDSAAMVMRGEDHALVAEDRLAARRPAMISVTMPKNGRARM